MKDLDFAEKEWELPDEINFPYEALLQHYGITRHQPASRWREDAIFFLFITMSAGGTKVQFSLYFLL